MESTETPVALFLSQGVSAGAKGVYIPLRGLDKTLGMTSGV